MKVIIDKSFEKDTDMIEDKSVRINIATIIQNVQNTESILKLKMSKN
jgi:hypothetical protein